MKQEFMWEILALVKDGTKTTLKAMKNVKRERAPQNYMNNVNL